MGTTVNFTPAGVFQYYLKNGLGQTFLSGTDGKQFALFSQNPAAPSGPPTSLTTYWIGVEDMNGPKVFPQSCATPGCGSDYDYNDVIVQITTPEPGFLLLTGLGFAGLLGLRRLKRVA